MKTLTMLFCVLHFAFCTLQVSEAQIIHVPGDYPTIQQGIDAAVPGDTVLVADGTYYGQISFVGKKPLMVASQYIMDGDTNHINNTILDGSQITDMDNASVVVFASGEDTTSILYGFTVRGGFGNHVESSNDRSGGGIYISDSGAKIIHNKITENTLDDTQPVNGTGVYGGGIGTRRLDGDFWIVIENNWIFNNSAKTKFDYSAGGGIFTSYHARIDNNVIYQNTSTCVSGGWAVGGGISHLGSGETNTIIIINNKIHHNIAQSSTGVGTDGGLSSQYAHLIFTNNEVIANSGITPGNTGGVGGISVIDPAEGCMVLNNTFKENISTNVGGAMHMENTINATDPNMVVISDNYFLDNESERGGAVSSSDIPIFLQNNVFKGNYASNNGGAIRLDNYSISYVLHMAILVNNTFSGNTAGNYGGAIYSQRGMPLVFNTIFYNNPAGIDGSEIYINHFLDTLDIANCNIDMSFIHGNVFDGLGNIFEDPMFDDPDYLTLQSGSPCLETGTKSYVCKCGHPNDCPDGDIEGYDRPQGSEVDMGAYEYLYVGVEESSVVSRQSLVIVYPNPTSGIVDFRISNFDGRRVSLKVYNAQGQEVATVLDGMWSGDQVVRWDASGLPAGIYYYRLTTNDQRPTTGTGKIVKY